MISVTDPDADLDLRIYTCTGFLCSPIASSITEGTSDETVVLVNPEPKLGSGDFYIAFVTNTNPNATEDVSFQLRLWFADTDLSSTRISMSRRAYEGRFHRGSIRTRGLSSGVYMGAVSMFDANGEFQGTTVIEAIQP